MTDQPVPANPMFDPPLLTGEAVDDLLAGIRADIVALDTNYVGQEGRGGAESLKREALRVLDRWVEVVRVAKAHAVVHRARRG